jgi:uncharacterized protein (DUF697 family)
MNKKTVNQKSLNKGTSGMEILTNEQKSVQVVKKYMLWSLGAGLIPVPLLDLATVTGVQLKMVSEISKVYGVEFKENRAKNIVSALFTSISANTFAYGTVGSAIKSIPLVGTLVGSVTMPFFSGAFAYALGTVFINHFEKGGTFLDFDSEKVKTHFSEMFRKGKKVATDLSEKVSSDS